MKKLTLRIEELEERIAPTLTIDPGLVGGQGDAQAPVIFEDVGPSQGGGELPNSNPWNGGNGAAIDHTSPT